MDEVLRRALVRVLDHDLDAAEALLAGVVQDDSDELDVYLALARLYRTRGEIGRAIRIHQNLLLRRELGPEQRVEALAGLAADFQQGGFLRRAIAAYEELLSLRPRHRDALRALTRLLADARDFPRALEMERRLAKEEGRDARAAEAALRVEWGAALQAEGQGDEARRVLRKALRRDPQAVNAWLRLGELEVERGRPRKAVDAWRRAAELDLRIAAELYPKLEATCASLGRAKDHERFLEQRLEAHPRHAATRLALARVRAARGAVEDAAAEARRVLEQDPEHLEAFATLGRVLLQEPSEAEVTKTFAELLDVLERQGLLRSRERIE